MLLTWGDIKRIARDLPDDAPVWIEYPARYGLAQPEVIKTIGAEPDDSDIIEAMSCGTDGKELVIYHHY